MKNTVACLIYHSPGLIREGSLFTGWGAAANGNPYNSRESPYLHLIFTQHTIILFGPKESKNIDCPISLAPNDASDFVCPP